MVWPNVAGLNSDKIAAVYNIFILFIALKFYDYLLPPVERPDELPEDLPDVAPLLYPELRLWLYELWVERLFWYEWLLLFTVPEPDVLDLSVE